MNYLGGKNGAGVYQQIINQMPPHDTYIEAFLGSGSVMRRKRPAKLNIGLDVDSLSIATFNDVASNACRSCTVINSDAIRYLNDYKFTGRELVYADPPYVMDSRKGGKIYRHEYNDADHRRLLRLLKTLPCMVMISGYWSQMYAEELEEWRVHIFYAQTRGGVAMEYLWMNYPEPQALHDYQFIGDDFRERERIKRKAMRWNNRLQSLPELERRAILSHILSNEKNKE